MENQKQPFQIALCEFPQDQTPGFQCGRVYQGALHGFASPKIARVFSAAIRWIFPIIQSRTGKNKMSTGLYSAFPAYLLTKRAKPHKIDPLTTLMGRKAKCPAFREPAAAASRWGTFADDCSRSLPPERT